MSKNISVRTLTKAFIRLPIPVSQDHPDFRGHYFIVEVLEESGDNVPLSLVGTAPNQTVHHVKLTFKLIRMPDYSWDWELQL